MITATSLLRRTASAAAGLLLATFVVGCAIGGTTRGESVSCGA